ncbi:Concanavalin A-like lectin/glucanase, subgroup [Artemisia annua]|uniref:Concanavalin A-like lectin/glucanase, subgroup n=1 Tax=Artemisia annua TaxID=35608 RepID=A0A2U1QJ27_ARTAN|nr:Concanavalin A-like lectin/glucanase, subgroup [Artemisia annua]
MMDQICNHFSLDEIRSATKDFSEAFVVGRGGFGKVYKGCFKDTSSMVVAIKRLNSTSSQGAPEFRAEIEMLSKLRHCNLVSLIGYCNEGTEMALVYEYMPHGTLGDHIHKAGSPLSWLKRLKICIGAARGLDYLHTGTGTQHGIVHRDVKSSNILLDENFAAKISDFGLAKVTPTNQTHTYVSTGVKGTFGYMDPCYFYSGKLTRKSDVYAFGVVLLEVMCGRPAVDESLDEDQWGLAPWAQDRIREGKLNRIIDSRLTGQISSKCLKMFADIACRCLHNIPNQRPTMAEIIARLEAILSLQERLDSSEKEGKFVNKVYLLFAGKPKASTLISARTLDGEGEPSNEIEGKVISASMLQSPSSTGTQTTRIHPVDLKAFSFLELKVATRNFRPSVAYGSYAGSSALYKGWIDEQYAPGKFGIGIPIAVKRLNESLQDHKEWLADIKVLGRLNHPNLVKIIGYCLEDDHSRFLVCEYMVKGSLGNHLLGRRYRDPFTWSVRLNIAVGFAKGLAYLHSPEVNIIYRELKSDKILLDSVCLN